MILLWGLPGERPLAAVHTALQAMGEAIVLVDQRRYVEMQIELTFDGEIGGELRLGSERTALNEVKAAYLRPYEPARVIPTSTSLRDDLSWRHAVDLAEALWCWANLAPGLVLNRPWAMDSNSSKPYQSAFISAHGFATPETLITNDPSAAREFCAVHGSVIYKSISGQRSIVSRVSASNEARWGDLVWCPTQFQQYMPGPDYRVHVVGAEIFACEVISDADDYRYAARQGAEVVIRPCELPGDCAEKCRSLVASMKLGLAGVDLRRTPNGQWFCFEVNPSPAFTFYQDATHQPIAEAIARLLADAS